MVDQFFGIKSNEHIVSRERVSIGIGDEEPVLEQENEVTAAQKAFLFADETGSSGVDWGRGCVTFRLHVEPPPDGLAAEMVTECFRTEASSCFLRASGY